MKFLMMIKHDESLRAEPIPDSLMAAMGEFIERSMQSGALKDPAGLKETLEGFRIRLADGKLNVTDGPFTEAKEMIGGYALFELPSKAEALEVAREFMEIHRVHFPSFQGECEVRPLDGPEQG